ncbi:MULTISPECIES: shikimate dehydrogenase [unclassified Enterococcus]|uniref:shikimate dehydrogenase n=1 Tax=unclassified Enterococcus TaxID=2608891 RepID=UPI0013EBECC8|nr:MULTISPECIES: shikimate dehydrogenase [unclassified Enterococcus]
MITGKTRLAGLFASPARHSLSPLMHNTAFDACGIDAAYLAFEVDQTNLKQAIESIRLLEMIGVNLSMPNKTAVLPYLDAVSREAELIGAVNTVVNKENKLIGYNTDGMGFMRFLKEKGFTIERQKVVLLGAGGAAKAIAVQAALDGAAKITVYKRKNETFAAAKAFFASIQRQTKCEIVVYDYADEDKMAASIDESDLLVNATDIGMGKKTGQSPLPASVPLNENLVVVDLIYSPRETRLLAEAKQAGAVAYNGLGMLVYQGAIAFELWTQEEMPIALIQRLFE